MTALAPRDEHAEIYRQQKAASERFSRILNNEVSSYREVVLRTFCSRMAGDQQILSELGLQGEDVSCTVIFDYELIWD